MKKVGLNVLLSSLNLLPVSCAFAVWRWGSGRGFDCMGDLFSFVSYMTVNLPWIPVCLHTIMTHTHYTPSTTSYISYWRIYIICIDNFCIDKCNTWAYSPSFRRFSRRRRPDTFIIIRSARPTGLGSLRPAGHMDTEAVQAQNYVKLHYHQKDCPATHWFTC